LNFPSTAGKAVAGGADAARALIYSWDTQFSKRSPRRMPPAKAIELDLEQFVAHARRTWIVRQMDKME
jgi:hypothetical protein